MSLVRITTFFPKYLCWDSIIIIIFLQEWFKTLGTVLVLFSVFQTGRSGKYVTTTVGHSLIDMKHGNFAGG